MPVDLERLLKLRLTIARIGEMDVARWWNTNGQLGPLGAKVLARGMPRTHRFAQARSVFAVAAHRCREVFDPPKCVTLWELPGSMEEEFEAAWERWLDAAEGWTSFFESIEKPASPDLAAFLRTLGLVAPGDLEALGRLKRAADGRAVPLPGVFTGSDADVTLLALGFARSETGALAVPYMRKADA
jgi:hypothetical protein